MAVFSLVVAIKIGSAAGVLVLGETVGMTIAGVLVPGAVVVAAAGGVDVAASDPKAACKAAKL